MKKLIIAISVFAFISCEEKKYEVPKQYSEPKIETQQKIDSIDVSMKRAEKIFDYMKRFKKSGMNQSEAEQALKNVNADDYDFYISHLKGE